MSTILVVEDDPAILETVSYNLRRGGNCLIDRDDAGQAVEAIDELGRPRLVRHRDARAAQSECREPREGRGEIVGFHREGHVGPIQTEGAERGSVDRRREAPLDGPADDPHDLVSEMVHRLGRTPTRVVVVPPGGVEGRAPERVEAPERGDLGDGPGQDLAHGIGGG